MGKDILDFLSEFATFLQERNFAVSESALAHLLKAVEDAGINITDEREMISALLVCLAKTGEQVAAIEVLFHKFLLQKLLSPKEKQNEVEKQEKKEKMDAAISDMKKQLESLQRQKAQIKKDMEDREDKAAKKKAFDDCVSDIQEQLENLEKIKERTVSDLKAQKEVEKQAKKKLLDSFTSDVQGQIKGLEKVKEQIRQNLLAAKQSENTLKISKKAQKYFAKLAEEKAPFQKQVEQAKALLSGNEPWSEKQAEKLSRVLMEQAEKCLYNGQFELADAAMEISKELSSAVVKQQKNADMLETEILEAQKETDQQIEALQKQIQEEQFKYQTVCQEVNSVIQEAQSETNHQIKTLQVQMKSEQKRYADTCHKFNLAVEAAQRETTQRIKMLQQQIRYEQKQYKETCQKLDLALEKMKEGGDISKDSFALKPSSVIHRADFIGGGSVQIMNEEFVQIIEKAFKKLTDADKRKIRDYLRQNLLAFKTRMTRNINSQRRLVLNMEETIRESIRTCGQPMNLVYKQPKRSKADLILILDVSGSCKDASELMLTFIGILKEIFPRGCSAFAFVNSLYDISKVYETEDVEQATKKILSMIPSVGQYSNYERPLRSMWEEYRNRISKDSMVIFIGDARNNKNDAGEEYIRNICRKAKCAYWLNTDMRRKWDQGDSIASVYGHYVKMYETGNIRQLLGFISEMR